MSETIVFVTGCHLSCPTERGTVSNCSEKSSSASTSVASIIFGVETPTPEQNEITQQLIEHAARMRPMNPDAGLFALQILTFLHRQRHAGIPEHRFSRAFMACLKAAGSDGDPSALAASGIAYIMDNAWALEDANGLLVPVFCHAPVAPLPRRARTLLTFIEESKTPPTYDEIEAELGWGRGTIARHMKVLRSRGLVVRVPGGGHSLNGP